MKRQGTGKSHPNEHQSLAGGPGREQGKENLVTLLRSAMPAVGDDAELQRDLWPAMQQRLNRQSEVAATLKTIPWFDWALAGGVALLGVVLPAAIPVLLYYL